MPATVGDSPLPFDRAFFARIDLREVTRAVEEAFHIIEQKVLRFGISQVEAVMIDDSGLRHQPFRPARLAYFARHLLPQFRRQGRKTKWRTLLPAPSAFDLV